MSQEFDHVRIRRTLLQSAARVIRRQGWKNATENNIVGNPYFTPAAIIALEALVTELDEARMSEAVKVGQQLINELANSYEATTPHNG